MIPAPSTRQLVVALKRSVGARAAELELKWMRQAVEQPPIPASLHPTPTFEEMLARRVAGEPLQYILGSQPFGPLDLIVRPPVLIPRPETEDWTIRLSERLRPTKSKPISILDLCTGSGCIALLLCHLLPPGSAHATGIDVAESAVQLAKDNGAFCGITVLDNGPPLCADFPKWDSNTFTPLLANIRDPAFVIAANLRPPYDILTANPPYIPKSQYDTLPGSVKDYEDPRALIGDLDSGSAQGLSFYHMIAALVGDKSRPILKSDGIIALEVGDGQAQEVARILHEQAQVHHIEIWRDPWDKERVVVGRSSP
ncbi:uncharacterized protein FIBRA_02295 [Fibroporia radiculosa]|uniref:Release factor glutamine methyltransferase N-terminal domain-containing protein n=1 Tax=Fibroporia radiculosa TaxID=599839 RepID=J4GMS4_9APHY|nr:uncharacterized protein FIBRA_02295 [Fibroporia radiculosa]CCM00265.1 predicted protein [Fibroporia radiculosa]